MTARAAAAERTGERVVDAMLGRFATLPYDRIRLEDVAADAAVTVQTVVRRFGGKPGLLAATVERELGRLAADREAAAGESPRSTVRALVAYYEQHAPLILKLYAEAHLAPGVPELAQRARAYHVGWCGSVFAERLAQVDDARTRARRLAQVVAVCDAATWRILREDGGLSPTETEEALWELLRPLLGVHPDEG
ncbi:TetR/AcrR family transcriptional regulator [Phycicoccus sonneratiae]|uniref:TetR/AcrR family transcriptional regulator n=1 Tax=Phycicoccus sonneratiae TaxID=2807628 RepID=A0ABS2CGD8_9MICO|nr:TetR/AcrR family transcriptional regulator [Phycicoccus sonneraticus]MBM6398845.1 TetR/AcrR family transcriptional regulator [Phycicoccus sonneraticus]